LQTWSTVAQALGSAVKILSLRVTKQSLQKIVSLLAMTDWNKSPTRSPLLRARGTPKNKAIFLKK
jgi:hypothetical protein